MIPSEVKETHPEYRDHAKDWTLLNASVKGETFIKNRGEEFLPYPVSLNDGERLTTEFLEDYEIYLSNAHYVEFTTQAIDDLVSGAFRKNPVVAFPSEIEYYEEDSVDTSKDIMQEVVTYGRVFSLVDYPTTDLPEKDLYAYIIHYNTRDIINWEVSVATGRKQLVRVVIKEDQNYRELIMVDGVYTVRLYTEKEEVQETQPKYLGGFLDHIPGTFTGVTSNSAKVDKSPMIGIAQSNLSWYRCFAEYKSVETYSSHPQLVLSGLPTGFLKKAQDLNISLRLGAQKTLILEGQEAKADLIEMNVSNLTHPVTLKMLEDSMVTQGLKIKTDVKGGVESAESLRIKQSSETTKLGSIVTNVEVSMIFLLEELSRFMGVRNPKIEFDMNREFFVLPVDSGTLGTISTAETLGTLPEGSTVQYVETRDLLDNND